MKDYGWTWFMPAANLSSSPCVSYPFFSISHEPVIVSVKHLNQCVQSFENIGWLIGEPKFVCIVIFLEAGLHQCQNRHGLQLKVKMVETEQEHVWNGTSV